MNLFELFGIISINSSGANQTIDETMDKVDGLKESLEGAEGQADSTGKKFGSGSKLDSGAVWLGNTISTVTNKIGQFAVNGAKAVTKLGIGFNANIETYQKQFEALLQNEEAAKALVEQIKELAKETPLGMEGLTNNAVSLLNAGVKLEQIIPTLEMLGNLALGDQNKMNGVARAYTQILGKGMLMAQEMYQLSDQGVPIIEIMTKYGGERYEDGSWYQEKMSNPKYKIPAEDMVKAFQAATAEGGKYFNYMFQMMDTYSGQMDRFGESGKETAGNVMQPFFNLLSSDIMPRLTSSLETFNVWVNENKESITAFSEAIGNFTVAAFDKALGFFQWITENGKAAGAALTVIAGGLAYCAISAHPVAAALVAAAVALAAFIDASEGLMTGANYDKFFDKYTDEDLQTLQAYVDAVNAARAAEEAYTNSGFDEAFGQQWEDALAKQQQAFDAANAIEGLIATYNAWRSGQAANQGKDLYLDVPLRVADGAEGAIQNELGGMSLEAVVHLLPDASRLSSLSSIATGDFSKVTWNAEGAIFSKPTIFNTPLGLQGVGDSRAPEAVAPIDKLQGYIRDAVRDTVGGMQFNIVLDSGALVGQLAPGLDRQLGTLASRKGRG